MRLSLQPLIRFFLLSGPRKPLRRLQCPVQYKDHEIQLPGRVDKPVDPGPFPAVILLHGCTDYLEHPAHSTVVEHASWRGVCVLDRRRLHAAAGTHAMVCQSSARALDVLATADFLAKRPDVQGNNIAVMGFSHRGSIVLDEVAMAADRQVNASRGTLLT